MLNEASINSIPVIVNNSFFWGGCPYKYDKKRRKLRITSNILNFQRWHLNGLILGIQLIYLLARCIYSWFTNKSVMEYNLCCYFLLAIAIVFTMQLMVLAKTIEMPALLNSSLSYEHWFKKRFVHPYDIIVKESLADKISQSLPERFYQVAHFFVFVIVTVYVIDPYQPLFPNSVVPILFRNPFLETFVGIQLVYVAYGALSLLSLVGIIFVYPLFIVKKAEMQLHLNDSWMSKTWTYRSLPHLQTPTNIIRNHRMQAVLVRMFEDIFSDFAMPYMSIVTRAVIFSMFMLIQYNSELDLGMNIFTATCVLVIPAAGFSILYFSASIYHASLTVQSSWKYNHYRSRYPFVASTWERRLWVTFVRSCRRSGVKVGEYYMIKYGTALTIIHTIMTEVAALLIAVRSGYRRTIL